MTSANSIPRYADPSPAELERIYHEPTPVELLCSCTHQGACRRLCEMWLYGDLADDERVATRLVCGDCTEWSE